MQVTVPRWRNSALQLPSLRTNGRNATRSLTELQEELLQQQVESTRISELIRRNSLNDLFYTPPSLAERTQPDTDSPGNGPRRVAFRPDADTPDGRVLGFYSTDSLVTPLSDPRTPAPPRWQPRSQLRSRTTVDRIRPLLRLTKAKTGGPQSPPPMSYLRQHKCGCHRPPSSHNTWQRSTRASDLMTTPGPPSTYA